MKYSHLWLISLLFLLIACNSDEQASQRVRATTKIESVTVQQDGMVKNLPIANTVDLQVNDGVKVDEDGVAMLAFPESMVLIEVLRAGDVTIHQLAEETIVQQSFGATLNQFDAKGFADAKLTIQSEFATITATGTQFLVVREANTPLEWIIPLDAVPGDLMVEANGVTKNVTTQNAIWVAPIGEPSDPIPANFNDVLHWLNLARTASATVLPEIGDIVWDSAVGEATSMDLPVPLPRGSYFPYGAFQLKLVDEPGRVYEQKDCNDDGVADVYMQNGLLAFNLFGVNGRVKAIDAAIINNGPPQTAALVGYNPAGFQNVINHTRSQIGNGTPEVLSLVSEEEPYHYAALEMADGCFTGFELISPSASLVTEDPPIDSLTPTVTPTPSMTPTQIPSLTPVPNCVIVVPVNWQPYMVQPGDTLFNLAQTTNTTIDMIQQANCITVLPQPGQLLWLPILPTPTFTVTPTPSLTPTDTSTPTYTPTPTAAGRPVVPLLNIISVSPDETVTIEMLNFPPNQTFTARMAPNGNQAIDGTVVGQLNSGSGEPIRATFSIPPELYGEYEVAIRLETENLADSFTAFTWFYNNNSLLRPITLTPTSTPYPTFIPSIVIVAVSPDETVTIETLNFPPNQTFTARMALKGTLGIDGIVVGELNSGSGEPIRTTFSIPPELYGEYELAIRLDSSLGYYAYNWFSNELPTVTPTATQEPTAVPNITVLYNIPGGNESDGTILGWVHVISDGNHDNGPVTVSYSLSDGTAVVGQDIIANANQLTWTVDEVNQNISKSFELTVVDDAIQELPETFTLTFTVFVNGVEYQVGGPFEIIIFDNDQPTPTPTRGTPKA